VQLNDDFKTQIKGRLDPNDPLNEPYRLFTKDDGARFDYSTTEPKNVYMRCNVDGKSKWAYWTF